MKKFKKPLATLTIMFVLLMLPMVAIAATDSKSTTINATIDSVISMTTSSTVSVSVTPVSGGAQSAASDTVTVSTNNSTGYTLTLKDSDSVTDLSNGSNTIGAHSGTVGAPTALANNSWGYHVDGLAAFGGSGSAESNVTSSAIKYAGISATAATIKTTNTTASGDTVTVWYGVKADTTKPSGTYSDTVTYTATTN